jgi:predicted peptidase
MTMRRVRWCRRAACLLPPGKGGDQRLYFLVVALAFTAAVSAEQKPLTFKQTIKHAVELDYLLHLPAGYDEDRQQAWPLILFLHGAGERGDDVERVATHGPPKLIAAGKDIPAVVVSPQCPANQWWTDHLEALTALLDQTARRYRVDPDRVYVTGLSMGGYGTWALLARDTQRRFAAAIPICGGGNRMGLLRAVDLPIWAFHGEADEVVPLDETTRLVESLQKRGAKNVKLTTYPGVEHDSWTQTYDDPAVWEWLFAQRRSAASSP